VRIDLETWLSAPPDAVWPYVSDATKMCLWSRAPIRRLEPGDGDVPGAMGELREVSIPWPGTLGATLRVSKQDGRRSTRLEEVIEDSQPPSRLVYRVVRVIGGMPVRGHRGEMRLEPRNGGTRFTWDVSFEFGLPGIGAGMKRILLPQLEASLASLARVVVGAPGVATPPSPPLEEPEAELRRLRAESARILAEQRELAHALASAGDPKQWFSRIYALVTENQIAACDSGRVTHPAWVLRLVPRFHGYYMESLAAWQRDRGGESHWRSAFHGMERADATAASPFEAVIQCVLRGARAHIDEDLPRALAEVHFAHYRSRCTMARFRADYTLMGDVFREATDRLMHELPPERVSRFGRAVELLPREAKDALAARGAIDLPRARRKAFERGERIASLLARHAGE
jgi:uncharacterized protein YndB with AHSA1/START domain